MFERGDLVWAILPPYTPWPAIFMGVGPPNGIMLVRFIEEEPKEAIVKSANVIKFMPVVTNAVEPNGKLSPAMWSPFLRAAVAEANILAKYDKTQRQNLLTVRAKARRFTYNIKNCICNPTKKNKSGMIFCARCTDWFHFTCLRMKKEPEDSDEFRCIACRTIGISDEDFLGLISQYNESGEATFAVFNEFYSA